MTAMFLLDPRAHRNHKDHSREERSSRLWAGHAKRPSLKPQQMGAGSCRQGQTEGFEEASQWLPPPQAAVQGLFAVNES